MSTPEFFSIPLSRTDPRVAGALANESRRQTEQIELIASENIVSRAVLDALGHQITNKTLEGYPGNRFHGGAQFVDAIEDTAVERAQQLFDCEYVNVQPHSGTQANQAVFFALLSPGDKVLSLDLAAGGHLSHGATPNLSGRWFDARHYGVSRDTGLIDYDAVEQQAVRLRPKLLIAGGSAYPREIDFARMRNIADRCGASLLVDMAHFAGLVAAGAHPSPLPHADLVTCTTTKTLRGPRGGLILSCNPDWKKVLHAAIFPGVQGSLHTQVIAAKAVCLGEALQPQFKHYGAQVKANATALAETLRLRGIQVVSGGTDTHLVLLDLRRQHITGQRAQTVLDAANITSNKNPVPFDSRKPSEWVGLRLGVGAVTTRGFDTSDLQLVGNLIADLIEAAADGGPDATIDRCTAQVAELCRAHPLYQAG
ncbi:MAG: serine hydroxymethyltransferase [Gammaproteobacteria bacterium]|nr:serine hydroxymethyltransferase [Gammaproteobacteria bacterium]